MNRLHLLIVAALGIAGCATQTAPSCPTSVPCPACAACPVTEPVKPAEKPLQAADWGDLPAWKEDDPRPALDAFRNSCQTIATQTLWQAVCEAAQAVEPSASAQDVRVWFESRFQPWALVNADGSRQGMITGYYEPVLKGSRTRKPPYLHPLFGPPDDLVVVDLAEMYPELKHMRLRGRLQGRKLVPYYSRSDWADEEKSRSAAALMWIDDPIDLFFMEIQGSGQIAFDDGSHTRVGYADQNGHPFRSVGRWLIDQGEMKADQASMQGIKSWGKAHPQRLREMLNANPSLVFFRELPLEGSGPPGALGAPLTPQRSIAIDPRHITLGAPVYLATTWPSSERPLNRLMLAQDTGGAIRGVVRADFYWGSGSEAGSLAGRMRQKGAMWILLPRSYAPN